jgi:hypothetical protein
MRKPCPIPERLILPVVLLLALTARLAVVFLLNQNPLTFDSKVYLAMADGILGESPVASFPNGYPVLIAIFKAVLPHHLTIPGLLVLNVLLGTATTGLVYLIARWLTPCRIALAVGLITALYPHQIHYTRLIMTETLCTFLLALGIFLLLYPVYRTDAQSPQPPSSGEDNVLIMYFIGGAVLHFAAAVRPSVNLVFPIVLLVGLLFRQPKKRLALLIAGYILSVGLFFGLQKLDFIRPPSAPANNMLISIYSDSRFVEFRSFSAEEQKRAAQTYIAFARSNPAKFLSQRVISLWELWGFWSLPGNKSENNEPLVRLMVFLRFPLLLLAGMAVWKYRRQFSTWVLFAPTISITILHTASFSNHRFIVPAETFLFILAGQAITGFVMKRQTAPSNPSAIESVPTPQGASH